MPPKKSTFTGDYRLFMTSIVEARRRAGLTQLELASRLKRPQSFVSKYERGERRLDLIEFLDVATALEIDITDFIERIRTHSSSASSGIRSPNGALSCPKH